ncbi:Outer membrane efflux protein [Phlyctochytrium bullatum]|nr:Outer membrane efflux protein [Phlyctochytrium bullatum]
MASKLASSPDLVIGATGNIGSGAVAAFLKVGATVVAPARSSDGLDSLKKSLSALSIPTDRLHTVPGISVSEPKDAEKLASLIKEKYSGLDHVVCSSGPWWNTPSLHQLDYDTFRKGFAANVDAHFLVWRHIGSLIIDKPGSSFVFINGAAMHMPAAGFTSVLAHSVAGLTNLVNFQTKGSAIRTNELLIFVRVESDADFAARKLTKQDALTHSSDFGRIFPALALGSHKGERIELKNIAMIDKFVKEANL